MTEPIHHQAEKNLISHLAHHPQDYYDIDLQVTDFSLPECRLAYRAIVALLEEGEEVGPLEIEIWSKSAKGRTRVDAGAMMGWGHAWQHPFHLQTMARTISEAAVDRRVRLIGERLATSPSTGTELLTDSLTAFNAVGDTKGAGKLQKLTDIIQGVLEDIERMAAEGKRPGLNCGIEEVDSKCLLDIGGVLTIAGRPSMGKTALAQYLAGKYAAYGHPVLYFPTESSKVQNARRYLSRCTGINSTLIGRGRNTLEQMKKLVAGASTLHSLPIWIDDTAATPVTIARQIRRARQKHGIQIAVVDHIQECIPGDDENREITQLINTLRGACREEPKVALILVSQLNRKVESRESKVPRLSDLRGSGTIEQASDSVIFCFRPGYYASKKERQSGGADMGLLRAGIAKHRDGPTREIQFQWDHRNGYVLGVRDFQERDE